MARKSSKSSRRRAESRADGAGPEAQEALEATVPDAGGGSITKTEAVRRALAAGKELPEEAVAYIKEEFGIDMAKPHFSAVKSQHRKKLGGSKPQGRPGRRPRGAVEGYLAPPAKQSTPGEGDLLAAIESMKPLVEALGADKVHRIVDLLG